ncbi:COG1470 family protein [Candidatus Cetobacterium colombiensis]|uniref:DUF11 domain-containing protein n=1 Tax=Candidatus Cetobacterium colombiensis TaxID=3073100 RepID=A0ABU4W9U2_9FUSO|nr:hypothetical protein [Candidatus Cetobacterium colombiensis]MDX8335900.1 hypothetical protein [Candidatus Cetobacterium colombiensis]
MKKFRFLIKILIFLMVFLESLYGREIDPLKEFTYSIVISNYENSSKRNIQVVNNLNDVKGRLANNGENFLDIEDNAFISWEIYRDGKKISLGKRDILDDKIVELSPEESVEYKIIAVPNEKLLSGEIKNIVTLYEDNQLLEKRTYRSEVLGSKAKITRDMNLKNYSPGDYLEYKVTVEPDGPGYLNNFKLKENLKSLEVQTLNGKKELLLSDIQVKSNLKDIDEEIDLSSKEKLVYEVRGKINENILGDIKYKGIRVKSEPYILNARFLNVSKYSPGKPYTYEIEVENRGKGNAGNVPFEFLLNESEVLNLKGETVKAFPENRNSIRESLNIGKGKKVVKKYSVHVDKYSVGDIESKVLIDSHTLNNKIFSHKPELKETFVLERYLDKSGTKKLDGYTSEGYIEYTLKVENKGLGILKDYEFNDEMEKLKTTSVDGKSILAFSNLDKTFTIGDKIDMLPGEKVEHKIKAKVSKESVGEIVKDSTVAKMANASIEHKFLVSKENYKAGEEINYTVILKNSGYGTAYEQKYRLEVDKALVSQSGVENKKVNAFKNSSPIQKTPVIYPGQEIKYSFKGITKNSIFDSIQMNSIYGEDVKSSEVKSLPGKLEFSNTLKSVNGKIITNGMRYKPGDMVTYEVVLKNIGEGFLDNLNIESNLDEVKALVAGSDVKEKVLEGINIGIKSSDPRTVITSKMGDTLSHIRKNVDFAPKSSITFEISGIVSDKSLGSLSGMIFKVNGVEKGTDGLGSVGGSISGEKTLLEPENGIYKPGDKLKYMLTIKNKGDGYGRSIPIEDILSEVTTEKEGKRYGRAFSNWKVTYLGAKDDSSRFKKYTYLKNEISGRDDLNTKVDIGPGVTIDFMVEADIDSSAIGVIESKAKIAGGTNDDQTIYLKPKSEYSKDEVVEQGIRVRLTSTKSEIKLGEVVGFTVNVENRDLNTYENLSLKNTTPRGFRYLDDEFEKFSLKPGEKYSKTFYMKATVGASMGKNSFQSYVASRNSKVSNIGETTVDIRGDSLLNTATIIGKVIDEETDLGIPYAVVYTPGGIVVQADEFGRFHLPDQWVEKTFGDNFSLKLDENSLPDGSVIKSENPMVKRITPYSLTKFNFIVKKGKEESKEDKKDFTYMGTGMIDAYMGKDSGKPRATYFGKGSYKDYKLTLHFDTKEKKNQTLLERITDDDFVYYPTYGDEAKIRKEISTNGKLYLKFEHKKSYVMWGNYETGFVDTRFMDYNKELYGFKGEYKEEDINVKVFMSTPNTMYGHDEFLGTGGSLYFLKNGDVLKGSQKVWIKIVDADSYVVEKIIYLQEGRDYEIDPFIGRVILTTPLNGGSSTDYYAYLVVDYSYLPKNGELVDSSNYGVKAMKDINENVTVGVTAVHESRGKENYDLKGVEVKLKDEKGNYIKGEFSTSEGVSGVSNYLSFDGGLTFQKVDRDSSKISGNAYRITGAVKLLEEAELKTWYERKERGYSFASDLNDRFLETFGSELKYSYSENLKSYLKFQYVDEMKWGEKRERGAVGSTKLEYILNESTKLYSEIKAGLTNALSLGAEKRINDRMKINARTSFGDSGNYFELGGDYQIFDNYNIYSGYSSDGEIARDRYTVGQRARLGERVSVYQESQYIKERGKNASLQGYGIDYDLKRGVTIGGSIQHGDLVLPNDEKSRRKGATLYLRAELQRLTLRNRVEYREDRGYEYIKQYFTTNSFTYKYSEEYTFAGKFNYSFTEDLYRNRYLESSVGLAYRPIENDRLNYLSRYTVILDRDTKSNKDFSAHIGEFETIYSFSRALDISMKNGYRREDNTYLNELFLLGLKANYSVLNSWEVFGQYQWLIDRASEDVLSGAIFGVYKNIDRNMKLGGGYNFSGFKDSLGEQDYKTSGWFLNIIGTM